MAALGVERWREQARAAPPELGSRALAMLESPDWGPLLEAVFGDSPFLTQSLVGDIEFAGRLFEIGPDAAFDELMTGLRKDAADEGDGANLALGLRRAKRRSAALIALADLAGKWPLGKVTAALSAVAETALQLACRYLLRKAAAEGVLDLAEPDRPELASGFIVLGMGKLGARELNYSSDVDLIVLYDDARVRVHDRDHMARTFIRLTRDLVRLMEERTADGYVFRTDLRLRPDPAATPLAVSVSAAEAYYGSLGQNWERAAMIKARPVAGDLAAGEAFLGVLQPWIWRRHLDFPAVQDIHSIKRQIQAHRGHHIPAVNGHNIKLGRGGIREIEFFAQTQQLIFGGRTPELRNPTTSGALAALVEAGRVAPAAAADLNDAYQFLRTVEHRLQMVEDRQTHEIPKSDAGVAAIAKFAGYDAPEEFRDTLMGHLTRVQQHYAALFEEAPSLTTTGNLVFTGAEDDPDTIETLKSMGFRNPSNVAGTIRGWHHGRYRATRSQRARELLTELVPKMLDAFAKTPHPDQAFVNFDNFLERLPTGVQVFSLFYQNPDLLDLVAEVMGTAPSLAEHLSRNPRELETVLDRGFFEPLPSREALSPSLERTLAREQGGLEAALDAVRRWTKEQQFRAGIHILRSLTDANRCGPFLADVAELAIAALQPLVEREFALRHGSFPGGGMAVLAMGALGGWQMTFRSDLDLIIVYEVPENAAASNGPKPLSPPDYYIRLTQRLLSAITSLTAEGRLYEVDMRLRPSGNKGPLAVSLEGFRRYQNEGAWTWEHMALTRARAITGPPELRERVEACVRAVLARPRDPDKLLRDVADMRQRIEREHGTKDVWNLKYYRGGLVDIDFLVQYLVLAHAHDHAGLLDQRTEIVLDRLAAEKLLPEEAAREVGSMLRLARRVQGFLRLTSESGTDLETAPVALRRALARAAFPDEAAEIDLPELKTRIAEAAARCLRWFEAIIEEPAARLENKKEHETQ